MLPTSPVWIQRTLKLGEFAHVWPVWLIMIAWRKPFANRESSTYGCQLILLLCRWSYRKKVQLWVKLELVLFQILSEEWIMSLLTNLGSKIKRMATWHTKNLINYTKLQVTKLFLSHYSCPSVHTCKFQLSSSRIRHGSNLVLIFRESCARLALQVIAAAEQKFAIMVRGCNDRSMSEDRF